MADIQKIKKIFFILVIIGILFKIFNVTNYLIKLNSSNTGLMIVGAFASIEIIALGVSLYYAWKDKLSAYSWIGVIILYSLYKSIDTMFKNNINFQPEMIPSLVLWIVIIIMAFALYYKFYNKQ